MGSFSSIFSQKNNTNKKIAKFIRNVFGFRPRNIDIYKIAITHRSSSVKDAVCGSLNNERLEYLGDAVLSAVVADFLFKKFPLFSEGQLTETRSKIVCRDRLNSLSRKIGLNNLIIMDDNIRAKCALGDAFEALVGAIYLDQGYLKTKKIVLHKVILTHLDLDSIVQEDNNYKSKVLSWSQKLHKKALFSHHEMSKSYGKRLFKVQLHIDDQLMGEGVDYTIKKAEQLASEKAWEKING